VNGIEVLVTVGLVFWILLVLALLVALFYVVPAVRSARRQLAGYERLAAVLETRVGPLLDHAEKVADNAHYLSTALRSDIDGVGRALERTTESVDRIVEMTEERLSEINGLLQVVQEEAEDSFYSVAGLLRGLRGRRSRERLSRRRRRRLG